VRLNAACREAHHLQPLHRGLKAANIQLDRRQLSEIAIADATASRPSSTRPTPR